jgi:D-alanine-D-alanine ligase
VSWPELGLPLIVKPAREGSTIGITKVAKVDHDELALAYAEAAKHDSLVLVEEFVTGAELTASIVNGPRVAADPHRGAAGQLRLSRQVLLRRDEISLSGRPARCARECDPRDGDAGLRRRRLQVAGAGSISSCAATERFLFLEVNTSPGDDLRTVWCRWPRSSPECPTRNCAWKF